MLYELTSLTKITLSHLKRCFSINAENNELVHPKSVARRLNPTIVPFNRDMHLVGGSSLEDSRTVRRIDKYSFTNRPWSKTTNVVDVRKNYSACSFVSGTTVVVGEIKIIFFFLLQLYHIDDNL